MTKHTAPDPLTQFRLDGRTAIVTGGSRGLGAVIAETFSSAGANVVLTATDEAALEERATAISEATGGDTATVATDIADDGSAERIIESALDRFGGIDILVNNAGINVRGPIDEISRPEFDRSMAVNLTGAWLLCRAARPHLADSGHGRVINISSTFGLVGVANRTAYATSKGALVQLTRALAMEWAPIGINVNGVAPGPFLTDMNIPFQNSEHAIRVLNHEVALRRWGELREIQGPVLFLASDAASYVTGVVLAVDGGWTAH